MKAGYLVFALFAVATAFGPGCQSSSNAVAGTNNTASPESTPPKTPSAATQPVRIESPDKAVIVGTLFEAEKLNSPALLLLHQWQSDRHSYDDFAKRMQARGFAVLSIDGRGFGESTKKADGTTVQAGRTAADITAMLGDVDASLTYLAKQPNVDAERIGIVGASYGSSLALIFAADNPRVDAAALLSPGMNYFGNMATEPAIKKYGDRPLMLVAAEDDKESADAVRKLAASGNNPKYAQKVYTAGGHGTALFSAKVGLEDLLDDFFTKGLH